MTGNQMARQSGGGAVVRPEQRLRGLLDERADEFGKALAGRVDPQAFVRVAYTTITKSQKLMEATPASVLMALLECATLGLVPNGVMGEAYLVPFNNKVKEDGRERWEVQAQFIPGYRGLIKLARNTGVIRNIVARPVYDGDTFEVQYGSEERLHHVPNLAPDAGRTLTHVWAMAFFTDGQTQQFEIMTKAEVDRIRGRSKSKDNGPWVTDYPEMALKTVTRRLCKRLPISDKDQSFARALEADNSDYMDVSEVAAQQQRVRLSDRFATPAALPVPASTSDFPAPSHADLDAAGLTGDVRQEPAPEPEPSADTREPEPGPKLDGLRLLLSHVRPNGKTKPAPEELRKRIRRLAQALGGFKEEIGDTLLGLANNEKLGEIHARQIIGAAFSAAVEVGANVVGLEPAGSDDDSSAAPAPPVDMFGG